MAFSGNGAQGAVRPRDAEPQLRGGDAPRRQNSLVVIPVVPDMGPMDISVVLDAAAACHRDATFLTELCPLRAHADSDLRHVWDEIGTKPHGIRRARLAGIDGLRPGAIKAAERQTDRQCQPANEMYDSHELLFPGLRSSPAPRRR